MSNSDRFVPYLAWEVHSLWFGNVFLTGTRLKTVYPWELGYAKPHDKPI